jgi:predicted nicotinamide N-methyase
VVIERARLRELAWGDHRQMEAVLKDNPGGFDVVMGADVVYVQEFITPLFETARRMLKRSPRVRDSSSPARESVGSYQLHAS